MEKGNSEINYRRKESKERWKNWDRGNFGKREPEKLKGKGRKLWEKQEKELK